MKTIHFITKIDSRRLCFVNCEQKKNTNTHKDFSRQYLTTFWCLLVSYKFVLLFEKLQKKVFPLFSFLVDVM